MEMLQAELVELCIEFLLSSDRSLKKENEQVIFLYIYLNLYEISFFKII